MFEKTKIKEKEAGVGPFFKEVYDHIVVHTNAIYLLSISNTKWHLILILSPVVPISD